MHKRAQRNSPAPRRVTDVKQLEKAESCAAITALQHVGRVSEA